MELGNLATLDNSNEGVWVQAELYGKKQDFELCILGEDSDKVYQYSKNKIKNLRKNIKGKDVQLDDESMDEILDSVDEDVICRLNGIRAKDGSELTMNGTTLQNDEKSYNLLIKNIPALKMFILEFSKDRKNFLSKEKKNSKAQ